MLEFLFDKDWLGCAYCKNFRNSYFHRTPPVAASVNCYRSLFSQQFTTNFIKPAKIRMISFLTFFNTYSWTLIHLFSIFVFNIFVWVTDNTYVFINWISRWLIIFFKIKKKPYKVVLFGLNFQEWHILFIYF